jgi:hypothetical protein
MTPFPYDSRRITYGYENGPKQMRLLFYFAAAALAPVES